MSILRTYNGPEEVLYTSNEMAARVGMSWAGLSKWLDARPRHHPRYTLEMGTSRVRLWDAATVNAILNERSM